MKIYGDIKSTNLINFYQIAFFKKEQNEMWVRLFQKFWTLCMCNLIGWLWRLKVKSYASLQISGIICSCHIVLLMGCDFSVDIYYNFSNVCFFFHLHLLFNRKRLKHIGFKFLCHSLPSASLLRISMFWK